MPAPVFPLEAKLGARVFFKPLHTANRQSLSYYGRVIKCRGPKWKVKLLNGVVDMAFDPATGIAYPNFQKHQLCWIADSSYDGLNYNEAMIKALADMREHSPAYN